MKLEIEWPGASAVRLAWMHSVSFSQNGRDAGGRTGKLCRRGSWCLNVNTGASDEVEID